MPHYHQPNPGDEPKRKCPFAGHSQKLDQQGFGPISRMCAESVFESGMSNPDLPNLHAREGEKFAAMAKKVAPPALAASYIQERSAIYPIVAFLDLPYAGDAFQAVLETTAFPGVPLPRGVPFYLKPVAESFNYFDFCSRDPNLLLACFYLAVSLQAFVAEVAGGIDNDQIRSGVEGVGRQFNAIQLSTSLPVALCTSLTRLRGKQAGIEKIDKEVILDSLQALHDNGQFSIKARGQPGTEFSGKIVEFKCPMEGFLFELLVKNEALQPIIEGICRANHDLETHGGVDPKTRQELPTLIVHQANMESVKACAKDGLRFFTS